MRIKLLVLAAAVLGLTGAAVLVANASEPLPAGEYEIALPGATVVKFTVDATGDVKLEAPPPGFEVERSGDEVEVKGVAGDLALQLEIGDGKLELELEDDGVAGGYTMSVTLPGGSVLVVEVDEDGFFTPHLPQGWTLIEDGDDEWYITDGTLTLEVEAEDHGVELKAVSSDDDDHFRDDDSGDDDEDDTRDDSDHDDDDDRDDDDHDDDHDRSDDDDDDDHGEDEDEDRD